MMLINLLYSLALFLISWDITARKMKNIICTEMKKPVELMPKPRTALFQGREDDEPTTHQVVGSRLAEESGTITNSFMKFGSFLVDVNASVIPYNDLFIGASSREKEKKQGKNAYKSHFLDHMQGYILK